MHGVRLNEYIPEISVKHFEQSLKRAEMLQQKNILFRGYVTMTGLGPYSNFGIKYKYNSAESNINTLLF